FYATGAHYDGMRYELDGRIVNLQLNGRTLDTVALNCQVRKNYFHGSVTGTDPNLEFCFDGLLDYERAEPISQYVLDVNKIDLQALGFVADELPFTLSGQVYTDYVGRGLDDILGNLSIRYLQVERHGNSFYLPGLVLVTQAADSLYKTTEITSDLLHLSLSGRYTLSRFPSLYREMLRAYVPGQNVFKPVAQTPKDSLDIQVFDLDLVLLAYRHDGQAYGVNRLLELFAPTLQLDENTRLSVHYDEVRHAYDMVLDSRYIGFKNILCTDGRVRIRTEAPAYTRMTVGADASAIYLNDSLSFKNFQTAVWLNGSDSIRWRLSWLNPSDSAGTPRSSGYMESTLDLSDSNALYMSFDSSYFVFAGRPWRTYPEASVFLKKGDVQFRNIGAYALQEQESVLLSGRWSADTSASIRLAFHAFDMAYLSPFTRQAGMEVAGKINGVLQVRDPKNSFDLVSDIELAGLRLNGGDYGHGSLTAAFNKEGQRINGQLTIGPDTLAYPFLSVGGYYDLKRKSVDFSGKMQALPVHFLSGYFKSFAEDLEGDLTGSLRISGPIQQMKWDLQAESRNLAMTVGILQTRYRFAHFALRLTEDEMRFNDGRM
ncbi:MAG: hypothetical protein K2O01_04500, partial [Bacteroidales bacterium]|nr:hypothetical protein [Bacteroidales bacterium]